MPESTSLRSPSTALSSDSSFGLLPRNARKRNFNLNLPSTPFTSHGSYAWDFPDSNCITSSTLPHTPPFLWDSIPNSNKCNKLECVSAFENWDCSPTLVVMEEDDIQTLLTSPKSPIHTPFSTTSDSNHDGPTLELDDDVYEESLTPSPKTPLLILEVAHTERTPKPTQLYIDTTSRSFEDTFTLASSPLFLDSPRWNTLICDGPGPDVPSDCDHSPSDFSLLRLSDPLRLNPLLQFDRS